MQITIASDPFAVRNGLATLLGNPIISTMAQDARSAAEIVLAEVLNNIVEHAYADSAGSIVVALRQDDDGILVTVMDHGAAFPQEKLPEGRLPEIDSFDDLPEGGFGWLLIRTLVRGLSYQRKNGSNHVSFYLLA